MMLEHIARILHPNQLKQIVALRSWKRSSSIGMWRSAAKIFFIWKFSWHQLEDTKRDSFARMLRVSCKAGGGSSKQTHSWLERARTRRYSSTSGGDQETGWERSNRISWR